MAPRPRPDPAPKTGIARRLEEIRHQNGIPSRRAFWQRVVDEWDENEAGRPAPSYAAVKLWHYDREPPIAYLACVAKVFGVRFLWLLNGEDEMTEADQQARDEIGQSAKEALAEAEVTRQEDARVLDMKIRFLHALGVLSDKITLEGSPEGEGHMTPAEMAQAMAAQLQRINLSRTPHWLPALEEVRFRYRNTIDMPDLARAMRALLVELRVDPARGIGSNYRIARWLDDFITAMIPALLVLAPESARQPKRGDDAEEA